ncbi:MAG: serine hydrolase [Candidatus Tantalella remota]|nr:serine hydrolase [Candidatus Tantalella remota]
MASKILSFILIGSILLSGCAPQPPEIDVTVGGSAAVIIDARNGNVLFEKNPGAKYPPASTTKIMTAIVAIETLSLDTEVVPTAKALYVEPTIAGLKPGVKYKLRDLISAILIKSANDAARAIAFEISGSEKDFAIVMNKKAERIGMENTHFASASGLPTGEKDSQYTTATDLAKMIRYASRYHVILDAMSKEDAVIYGSDGKRIYLKTHNKSLFKYPDAPWGKTGYTIEARRTFAGVDPSYEPRIAFGLLRSNDLWNDIMTLKNKGLELYEMSKRTRLFEFLKWMSGQRERGREGAIAYSG